MDGVENSHTIPARGKLYTVSNRPRVRPSTRTKGGALKFVRISKWLINSYPSIKTEGLPQLL